MAKSAGPANAAIVKFLKASAVPSGEAYQPAQGPGEAYKPGQYKPFAFKISSRASGPC